MDFFSPKYASDPNEKVHSIYAGVSARGGTVLTTIKAAPDRNSLIRTTVQGPAMPRGEGGRAAILVLGGMETTLAEMQYILEAKQNKKFVPKHTGSEIAQMCRLVQERRNEAIMACRQHIKKNPSEAPRRPKKTIRLLLPVGCRYVPTSEPGLRVLVGA